MLITFIIIIHDNTSLIVVAASIAVHWYGTYRRAMRSVVDDELEVRQLLQCYVQVYIKAK